MSQVTSNASLSSDKIHEIPLDQIERDEGQLRKEFKPDELEALAESIKNEGQIQPILVTKGKDGKYKIVDGERRWRAFNRLVEQAQADTEPLSTIKAIYVEEENQLVSIIGNIVRNNYNPMETADAIALIKKALGDDVKDIEIAKRIGKGRTTIVEYISLLKLPKEIQEKARKDSCVPHRRLVVLARDKKKSPQVKIAEYDKLHKKYEAEREKEKKSNSKSLQNMETRSVVAVWKKLEDMKTLLEGVKFTDKVDKKEKDVFKKSLQEIIDTAQTTLNKL